MKSLIIIGVLLVSSSAMAQNALHGDASDYNRIIDEKCFGGCHSKIITVQNQSQMGNRGNREPPKYYDIRDCMVYIPAIKDEELRKWCVEQSKKLP